MDTAGAVDTEPPRAEPARAGATLPGWLVSVALLPCLVGLAAALRDGPGGPLPAALAAAGAVALAALAARYREAPQAPLVAGLVASATLAVAYLAQRGAFPLEVAVLALPVAAAAAGASAASSAGGLGAAILLLAPLPALIALMATGQLTLWALFTVLAVPDALAAAGAALRGTRAGGAAARAQLRVTGYLALALLLSGPRY